MLNHLDRVLAVLQSSRLEGFRERPCLEPDAPACPETPAPTPTPNSTRRPLRQPLAAAALHDWPERLARAFSNGFCAGPALELQQRPLDALLSEYRPAAPFTGAVASASNLVSSFSLLVRSTLYHSPLAYRITSSSSFPPPPMRSQQLSFSVNISNHLAQYNH